MSIRPGIFADHHVMCMQQDAMSTADDNVVVKGSEVGQGLGVFANIRSFDVGDVIVCESPVCLLRPVLFRSRSL